MGGEESGMNLTAARLVLAAVIVVAALPTPAAAEAASASAVVAVVDLGINPYHQVFRSSSPLATQHPSTYIEGFPADAEALHLTLDAPSYDVAVATDCERVWRRVQPGRLYWIPGTKIIGAMSIDAAFAPTDGPCPGAPMLDSGHGTMTASRAAADAEWGACRECLIVAVQGLQEAATTWAASQSEWIDLQTNSWGPGPVWEPTGTAEESQNGATPAFVRAIEAAAQRHPTFFASGNGVLTANGLVTHPTYVQPEMTPSVIAVGGHDSGFVQTWPDAPVHVVSDACASWAARAGSLDAAGADVGSGTSAASPFVAGKAASFVLEARRLLGDNTTGVHDGTLATGTPTAGLTEGPLADGRFTVEELRQLTFATATARPAATPEDGPACTTFTGNLIYGPTPIPWSAVPPEFPEYALIGYGAVDTPAAQRAVAVLRGELPLPDRTRTDTFFQADAATRAAVFGVYGRDVPSAGATRPSSTRTRTLRLRAG